MFSFGSRDDAQRNARLKYANYRMDVLRHNPYIGTFHGKPILNSTNESSKETDVILDAKTNPMVGVFRHSPSSDKKSLGFKAVIYNDQGSTGSVVSQLTAVSRQVTKPSETLSQRNFVSSLRQIPVKVYSSSSSSERGTTDPKTSTGNNNKEEPGPVCAICLEQYADGDELLTLACSHCFHSDCVSKWFFQGCLNNTNIEKAFSCPECRQEHITLSEHGSVSHASGSCNGDVSGGIPSRSFLQMGQSLLVDGGYDFLSDAGSENNMVLSTMAMASTIQRLKLTTPSPEPTRGGALMMSLQQQRLTPIRPTMSFAALSSPQRRHPVVVTAAAIEQAEQAAEQAVEEEVEELAQDEDGEMMLSAHPTPQGGAASFLAWSTYSDCGFPLSK
jgi:hypothetical protein